MFLHDLTEYDTALVQRQGDGTWIKQKRGIDTKLATMGNMHWNAQGLAAWAVISTCTDWL